MTLKKQQKSVEAPYDPSSFVGGALQEAIWQALDQGRLTCGVHQCAQLLQIDPFNAMLCVIPESPSGPSADVSEDIKHILIEAFCTEYDIRVVKVDSASKLTKIVQGRDCNVDNATCSPHRHTTNTNNPTGGAGCYVSPHSVDCLLVQYPEDVPSKEDEIVAEYYKKSLFADQDLNPCIIALPD